MFCTNCGKELPQGIQHCDNCVPASPAGGPAGEVVPGAIPEKTSALAVASLILGVVGLCGLTAIAGLVTGIAALISIGKSGGQLKGKGLAITGIVCSVVWMLLLILIPALLVGSSGKVRSGAEEVLCRTNLYQLGVGIGMYAQDNEQRLPEGGTWSDAIGRYVSNRMFMCPAHRLGESGYAFNAGLSGKSLDDIPQPSRTVLLFESDAGLNVSGGPELMIPSPRHRNGWLILFADFHVESVKPEDLDQLIWNIEAVTTTAGPYVGL